MASEVYEFWKMVLHSPVAIALAGGLAGSFITLVVTLLKFRHDAKANKLSWERQEVTRKGERAFECKSKAYEDFFTCFETTFGEGISKFDRYFAPSIMRLMLYGSLPVKISARKAIMSYDAARASIAGSSEYVSYLNEAKRHCDDIHTRMMEDIGEHFNRDDVDQWEKSISVDNKMPKV